MSYILDALKKSEAERARGAVPNLHTQSDVPMPQPGGRRVGILVALLVMAAMVAAFAWFVMARMTTPQIALAPLPARIGLQVSAELAPPKPVEPIPPAVNTPAPPTPVPAPVTQKAVPAEPAVSAPVAKNDVPKVDVKPKIEEKRFEAKVTEVRPAKPAPIPEALPVKKAEPVPVPLPVKKAVPAEAAAAPPENRVGSLQDLPPNVQKDVPPVAFGGYIYSNNPADRSVLIGNRLLREGDQVAPGLTLEKMLPKEAILNYMGYRFRVSY